MTEIRRREYYKYYARTYRVDYFDGRDHGYLLNFDTADFELDNSILVEVSSSHSGGVYTLTEDEFISQTELERQDHLVGDGPIFALYRTIQGISDQPDAEGRDRHTSEEVALIEALRKRTFKMWEEDLARRAAGEPMLNTFKKKVFFPEDETSE